MKTAYCVIDAYTIEIRQVARGGCRTHAVEVDPNGCDTRVLCGRVKLDSMCDTPVRTEEPPYFSKIPMCSRCARKLQKNMVTYWSVASCVEGEAGFHPVSEYGTFRADPEGKKLAQEIVDRLNERLGHGPPDSMGHKRTVHRIVVSANDK